MYIRTNNHNHVCTHVQDSYIHVPAVIEGVPLVQVGMFAEGSIVTCIGTARVIGDCIQLILSDRTWGQRVAKINLVSAVTLNYTLVV